MAHTVGKHGRATRTVVGDKHAVADGDEFIALRCDPRSVIECKWSDTPHPVSNLDAAKLGAVGKSVKTDGFNRVGDYHGRDRCAFEERALADRGNGFTCKLCRNDNVTRDVGGADYYTSVVLNEEMISLFKSHFVGGSTEGKIKIFRLEAVRFGLSAGNGKCRGDGKGKNK